MDKNLDLNTLQEENEKLVKACAMKTDMVSMNAHQIRTSLSALKWIIKMFLDGDLGALNPEQENLMQKAYESNERAVNIVNELLLANKTENIIEKEYVFDSINIIEIIDNAIFDFSGETHSKKIEIIFLKPDTDVPKITADKDKVRIVVQNLLDNAIKYSEDNGKVFITVKATEKMLKISVKNNGLIISEESKGNIFSKFYRSPEAQEKEVIGSGIGLFIIKDIVERHGGKIWFESEPEDGTTFFVELPIAGPSQSA